MDESIIIEPVMNDDGIKVCSLLIRELSEHVKELSAAVHKLTGDVHAQALIAHTIQTDLEILRNYYQEVINHSGLLQVIRIEFETIKENQRQLLILVRDGNGKPGLVTRATLLEESLGGHLSEYKTIVSAELKSTHTRLTVLEDTIVGMRTAADDRKQGQRHRWEIYAAIISGIMGMLGGALALFGK